MTNLTKSTKPISEKNLTHEWKIIDAKGKPVGRIATQVVGYLMGKHKSIFVSHLDCGDNVVVINAKEAILTGNKANTKTYANFSGYPGGLKKVTYEKMLENKPEEIVRHAISGMLPKNKLRDVRLRRLYIYKGTDHPYSEKFV